MNTLQEATMELTVQAFDRAPEKGDENLHVKFSNFPHFNEKKSHEEGRPIFDERCYITIIVPGQQDIVHRVAWRRDFERFPKQYQAFRNNESQDAASGTPLKVLPWLQASQVKELEYFNCHTVEQLANIPDATIRPFMSLQKMKQMAKDWLEQAAGAAPLVKMRSELEQRDNAIQTLQRQLSEQSKIIEKLQSKIEEEE